MRLREAAERIGGWVAPENYEKPVLGVASLDDANEGDISFYGSPQVPQGAEEIACHRRSGAAWLCRGDCSGPRLGRQSGAGFCQIA